jgi:hypothetical protein
MFCVLGLALSTMDPGAPSTKLQDADTVYHITWTPMRAEHTTSEYLLKHLGLNEWMKSCDDLGGYPLQKLQNQKQKYEVVWCAPTQVLATGGAVTNVDSGVYPYTNPPTGKVDLLHLHQYVKGYNDHQKASLAFNAILLVLDAATMELSITDVSTGKQYEQKVSTDGWMLGTIQQLNLENCDKYTEITCHGDCVPHGHGLHKPEGKARCCSQTNAHMTTKCPGPAHFRCGGAGDPRSTANPICNGGTPKFENIHQCRSPKLQIPYEIKWIASPSTANGGWECSIKMQGKDAQQGFVNTYADHRRVIPNSNQIIEISLISCGYSRITRSDGCVLKQNPQVAAELICGDAPDGTKCVLAVDTTPWYRRADISPDGSFLLATLEPRGSQYDAQMKVHAYGLPPMCVVPEKGRIVRIIDLFSELGDVTFPTCNLACIILVKDFKHVGTLSQDNVIPIQIVMDSIDSTKVKSATLMQDCPSATHDDNWVWQSLIPVTDEETKQMNVDHGGNFYTAMVAASRGGYTPRPSVFKFQVVQVDPTPCTTTTTIVTTTIAITINSTTPTQAVNTTNASHTHNHSTTIAGNMNTSTTSTTVTSTTTVQCGGGQYEAQNVCVPCPNNTFNSNDATTHTPACKSWNTCNSVYQHILTNGNTTNDVTCQSHINCSSAEYETTAPSMSNDRACDTYTACTGNQYIRTNGTEKANRICWNTTVCKTHEYELTPATTVVDRECRNVTKCPGTAYEHSAPNNTTDRKCFDRTVCTSDEYQQSPGDPVTDATCTARSVCDSNVEFKETAATNTTDAKCTPFTECESNQYQTNSHTATSDVKCAYLTPCNGDEYETQPPTSTSDRRCRVLSTCVDDEYETAAPTGTSNRICTNDAIIQVDIAFVGLTLTTRNTHLIQNQLISQLLAATTLLTRGEIKNIKLKQTDAVIHATLSVAKAIASGEIQADLKSKTLKVTVDNIVYTSVPIGSPIPKPNPPTKKKSTKHLILPLVLSGVFILIIGIVLCGIRSGELFGEPTAEGFIPLF